MAFSAYRKKYTGMKRTPEDVIKRVRDRKSIQTAKAKAKRLEQKKVRPHETMKEWESRMRRFNLMTETQIQRILGQKKQVAKVKVRSRELLKRTRNKCNTTVEVEFHEKQFDFLSYYGIVLNYFSVKYGIRKEDIEICMAFYNNKIIDVNSFSNICILNTGTSLNYLKRFKKNNYICEIVNHVRNSELEVVKNHKIGLFTLHRDMQQLITAMYKIIAKLNTLKDHRYKGMFPKELEIEFVKMNQETESYLTGDKKQLNIKQIKQ